MSIVPNSFLTLRQVFMSPNICFLRPLRLLPLKLFKILTGVLPWMMSLLLLLVTIHRFLYLLLPTITLWGVNWCFVSSEIWMVLFLDTKPVWLPKDSINALGSIIMTLLAQLLSQPPFELFYPLP